MKKNILLVISCILIGASGYWYAHIQKTSTQKPITPLTTELRASELIQHTKDLDAENIKIALTQSLKEKEVELWETITEQTGIDKAACDQKARELQLRFRDQNRTTHGKNTQSGLSQETTHEIRAIIQECGLDALEVYLAPDTMETSPAAADTNVLHITEALFNKLTPNEKKFVIAHELGHIVNQDVAHLCALELMTKQIENSEKIMCASSKFREERADLFSINQGPEYRAGAIEFASKLHALYGTDTADSHPTFIQRLSAAQSIDKLYQTVATA